MSVSTIETRTLYRAECCDCDFKFYSETPMGADDAASDHLQETDTDGSFPNFYHDVDIVTVLRVSR